ncbi:hypothetical protein GQ53DRAFT_762317 [Thozetella sp. PMI_491]|nr:hypothetical protein GQ53DRAFT_762317 [Thozetella sp. PMI_491]
MERDTRRARGQWRGCYSFKDIILDGDSGSVPKRNGGLKMGQTYYYYYELDGSTEAHDPSLPSTTACPYLPGQAVNTMWVPVEHNARKRSASLNSVRDGDFKTMNPRDKFVTPRPAPSPPLTPGLRRLPTSPMTLQRKRSARSLSPAPNWMFSPRKLFSRMASSSSLRDARSPGFPEDQRSTRSHERSHSRDMSPESLRRFLMDETSSEDGAESSDRPAIAIPEDIEEECEDNEDDANFATSATSETMPFTVLSPPPTQRSFSPSLRSMTATLDSDAAGPSGLEEQIPDAPTRSPPCVPRVDTQLSATQSRFSMSDSSLYGDELPESPDSTSIPQFYHSESEDEDADDITPFPALEVGAGNATDMVARNLEATFSTYSLPRTSPADGKLLVPRRASVEALGSPALVARNGTDMPLGNTSLLTNPIPNSGLDDLMSELGWMADVIASKAI